MKHTIIHVDKEGRLKRLLAGLGIIIVVTTVIILLTYGKKINPTELPNVYKSTDKLEFTLKIGDNPKIIPNKLTESESLIKIVSASENVQKNTYVEDDLIIKASIINLATKELSPIDLSIEKIGSSTFSITGNTNNEEFAPGKHELNVEIKKDGETKTITQDFSWGVLAINTNKSAYAPEDKAKIALAVLDENGDMVCDADVELNIYDPRNNVTTLSTKEGTIKVNPGCNKKELILEADYEAEYATGRRGEYEMVLKANTKNGTSIIRDTFEVSDNLPFNIERVTATRIYPVLDYPVLIKVTANQDYKGKFSETVPSNFGISNVNNEELQRIYDFDVPKTYDANFKKEGQNVIWDVSWEKGKSYYYAYKYDAPNKSPDFYTLGPLKTNNYEESRKWQIAVDAVTDIRIAKGTFTSPGSTGNDSITGIGFQPKAIMVYGTLRTDESWGTDGNFFLGYSDGTTHKSHAIKAEDGVSDQGRYSQNYLIELRDVGTGAQLVATLGSFDSDGFTINYTTANSGYIVHYVAFGGDDLEAEVGEEVVSSSPLTIASSTLEPDIIFVTTSGVTIPTSEDSNAIFSFGAVDSDSSWYVAPYVGANSTNSTGILRTGCAAQVNNTAIDWEMTNCTLTTTGMTWSGSNADEFSYLALDLGGNSAVVDTFNKETSGTTNATQDITGWGFTNAPAAVGFASAGKTSTTLSSNSTVSWGVYDGANQGTIATAEPNASNAADTYQNDDNVIAIPSTTPATVAGGTASDLNTDGVTLTWNPNNTTGYLIGYWAIEGNESPVPVPSYPFDNAEVGTTTPKFEFIAADVDGTRDIIYEIEWDDNTSFSSPTTRTSDTHSGFENIISVGDTSPFNENETVRFTVQAGDALSNSSANTAYYWRLRAKPSGGSFSSWSDTYSLRVNTSLKINRWLQTTDEQFDTDTLNKTQTSGSDNIGNIGGTAPAIAWDGNAVSTNSSSSTHTSISTSHTVSGDNTILFVICQGENQSVSSVTWGTESLTNISGASRSASGTMISTWYITGVSGTATATCNLSSQDNSGIIAISYTGVSQISPIGNTTTAGANSSTITRSFTTAYDDSMILEIITGDGGDTDPFTPTSGQTERWDFASGTSTTADTGYAGYERSTTTAGSYALNATQNVTDDYSFAAVEMRQYDPNWGEIYSTPIDFDSLPNMSTWNEFDWTETETSGTINVSLYYTNATTCDTIVPNAALSGNEAGFSSGPIDISGLNTTTYNEVCLYAYLASDPYLEDWYISWALNVSGTVYLENKTTPATTGAGGQCNSSTENLTLRVDGANPVTTSCSSTDGTYTFTGVEAAEGDSITIYSTATDKSNRVYTSNGGGNTGQDMYKNAIAVLDLYDGTLDITEMIDYDNDQNSTDMLYDAEDASPDTLTWESGTNLYIPTSEAFGPGGNTNGHDIYIDGTWQAASAETINVDGSFWLNPSGTFNASTSTLIFDGTSGTEYLGTTGTGNIYNLELDDSGGSLVVKIADDLVVDNDITISDGTLDVRYTLTGGEESFLSDGSFYVPAGVTEVTVKAWGAGGGGGAGGSSGVGGAGGGGGFVQSTLTVTPEETLDVVVGTAGTAGTYPGSNSGGGGGGGGRSTVERSGTPLVIAAGGAGGGGGDNSSTTAGGAGGGGGGATGQTGSASSNALGGTGGTSSAGGTGGTGGGNVGADGSSEQGGYGANGGADSSAGDGGALNGGSPNGGHGGTGDTGGFAGGGGGGDGYYGGGGGSGSASGNAGGGGGGGGSSYVTGASTTNTAATDQTAANDGDADYPGGDVGYGGSGGATTASGEDGNVGYVTISYSGGTTVDYDIYVAGDWVNDDTLLERTGTIIFDGAQDSTIDSGCTVVDTCTINNFYYVSIEKSEDTEVTLTNTNFRSTSGLRVLTGIFNQGDQNVRVSGTPALEIEDFGRYRSLLTGDLKLGGDLTNDGEITLNANGGTCGDADDITVTSTTTTNRDWSGAGGFRLTDVTASYQTGTAVVHVGSGTDNGNNLGNWAFIGCNTIELNGLDIEGLDFN